MTEQSPQSPAVAPPKPWYMKWWVWLIAAVVVIGGIGALVNPEGIEAPAGEANAEQTAPAETQEATAPAQDEAIYEANEAINSFVMAFNVSFPDQALTSGDLTVHRLGHGSKVVTQINGTEVVITEDAFSHGAYGVSIYWDNPTPGAAEANIAMFHTLLGVLNPGLSGADVDSRWQEVLDTPTHYVEWDDGTEIMPGPTAINNEPGTFGYVKLYG